MICAAGISGCASVDPNYALAMKAYSDAQVARAAADKAQADTVFELARSIEAVGVSGSEPVKMQAIMGIAMIRQGQGAAPLAQTINIPTPPDSPADKALRFVGALAPLAVQGYGIWANKIASIETARMNSQTAIVQSNNNAAMFASVGAGLRDTSISAFGAMRDLGGAALANPRITASEGATVLVGSTNSGVIGAGRVGATTVNCPGTTGNAGSATAGNAGSGNAAGSTIATPALNSTNTANAAPSGPATVGTPTGGAAGGVATDCKG
jgi:hypothetical protein